MKTDVTEYGEGFDVEIHQLDPEEAERASRHVAGDYAEQFYRAYKNRNWIVCARNEGGFNGTEVDLVELLRFVKKRLPEIWDSVDKENNLRPDKQK